jgi:toxin ParE1/3/4
MPHEVVFSAEAEMQLQEIEAYLAERSDPANAERFVERLAQACLSLGAAPHRGTKRDDLVPGLRTIGFERRTTVYFKLVENRVLIVSVLYGGRTFEPSL